jgi:hypothetical protein
MAGADEGMRSDLRELLYEWDPIGVAPEPDWPRDEYDDLIEPLLNRLRAGATAGELAVLLEEHVNGQMGLEVDVDREERFAARLVQWWAHSAK